jgi:hypothetical protein
MLTVIVKDPEWHQGCAGFLGWGNPPDHFFSAPSATSVVRINPSSVGLEVP